MKTVLRFSMVLMLLMVVGHAQVINNMDAAPADTNYWEWFDPVTEGGSADNPAAHYAISTNADPTLGWIETSYVTDNVLEGTAAMRVDYSIHNSEGWGGYTKIQHRYPDTLSTGTYDWGLYDSLSFSYYNVVPQDSLGRVHLRLNLLDYGDITDSSYSGLGEFWYSFSYILDDEPGWHTVEMLLEGTDTWDNAGFTHTGWSGTPGNLALDKDRIKGYALEFSVSGSGAGDVVTGSVIFDDFKLTGSRNELDNPGFEFADVQDDAFGWGVASADGATATIEDDAAGAYSGSKYGKITTSGDSQWTVIYEESDHPAAVGETWEFGGYVKDISAVVTEGSSAALKFETYDADGNKVDHEIGLPDVTTEWEQHSIQLVIPAGTATVKAVIVGSTWAGPPADYAFDEMYLVNLGGLDTEAPPPVENVSALPGTNYNLVTWEDVPTEEGETYTIYASMSPISDVEDPAVDVLAAGHLEGAPSVVHYLYTPTDDAPVEYYYAVSCTDASQNVGEPGLSPSSYTNTALGIPTISMDAPADFVADGFLDEWTDVTPFFIGDPNSWGVSAIWGAVDNNDDASGNLYIAMDDDFMYVAAEVTDNVYEGYVGEGNWWEMDAFELFFGLYDWTGPRHNAMYRGDKPDYKLVFTDQTLVRDVDGQLTMATTGDGNYYFEGFNPDYVFEAKVSLDSLASASGFTDARYTPVAGDRIIMEPVIHDNDGGGTWEGNVMSSPTNTDNAWQTTAVWSHSFVSAGGVAIDDIETPATYSLSRNYPNPFNPSTIINYEIGQSELVKLTVYNVLGQEVMVLVNDVQQAGAHEIQFQAGALASGIYMYRLEAGNFTSTHKMILMK
ncbi:MAG: T9SS type A sorting domain-containing protein [Candidatus Marinimicrobia bacterium]|nr:T9SS type A sorting domain-containing protein [Candidatus Neomarinimicrobiota bacterium]